MPRIPKIEWDAAEAMFKLEAAMVEQTVSLEDIETRLKAVEAGQKKIISLLEFD